MRGRASAMLIIILAVLTVASQSSAADLESRSESHLLRLLDEAKGAPANDRPALWFDAAAVALRQAGASHRTPGIKVRPVVARAYREALPKLSASALSALGTIGWGNPALSEAFCRAVVRDGGPRRVAAEAEAAAEARDALVAALPEARKPFLEVLGRGHAAAFGAGGTMRSPYWITILGESGRAPIDSSARTFRVAAGVRAGITAGAGAWAPRFRIDMEHAEDVEFSAVNSVEKGIRGASGPGVVLVARGSGTWTATTALAVQRGVIVVDARSPDEVPSSADVILPETFPDEASEISLLASQLIVPASLEYLSNPDSSARIEVRREPFQLRPTAFERARRLARVVAARPEVRTVVIAIPETGGDRLLAIGFMAAMKGLGREAKILVYSAGRREFSPEVRAFAASNAQAILFAGLGEESGEWLLALSKARLKPLLLGTSELAPEGFHASMRFALEGAVFAGSDWEDREARDFPSSGTSAEFMADADWRRGYRFGWMVGRAVVSGAYTTTSLQIALHRKALPRIDYSAVQALGGVSRDVATAPSDLFVPLFEVKGGKSNPLLAP